MATAAEDQYGVLDAFGGRSLHEQSHGESFMAQGSQFIVATHSPILLGYPGAAIYLLTEGAIARVAYTETEHYVITKSFLNNPEGMLRELLSEP